MKITILRISVIFKYIFLKNDDFPRYYYGTIERMEMLCDKYLSVPQQQQKITRKKKE